MKETQTAIPQRAPSSAQRRQGGRRGLYHAKGGGIGAEKYKEGGGNRGSKKSPIFFF